MRLSPAHFEAFASRLGLRMLGTLVLVLTVCSLAYLAVFSTAFGLKLNADAEKSALQAGRVLEASLKPALVSHDVVAIRGIMAELQTQPQLGIAYLLNAAAEVRYSSGNANIVPLLQTLPKALPSTQTLTSRTGETFVRVISPLHNEARCENCHGSSAAKPLLGALVLDQAAPLVRHDTIWGGVLMALAGGTVMLVSLYTIASSIARRVLLPVRQLNAAAQAFTAEDFAVRADISGDDEMAALGAGFDGMADRIGTLLTSIRMNEDFLQRVIDAVPDGIRVIASDFTILKVNAAYCRQLGISSADAVGRPCHASSHQLAAPCSPRLVTCPLAELSRGGRASLKCQHRHLRHDGSEMFAEVSAAFAVIDHNGRPQDCVIESIRDLGEQTEMSHKYRLAELGQLATGIAHEIHNPLWSIHLALSAIRDDMRTGKSKSTTDSYLETADQEINKCLTVTNRLLKLGEPASEEISLISLHEVVAGIARLVSYEARLACVTIQANVPEQLRTLANESDLSIVVLNLVQNAIHSMPAGGELTIAGRGVANSIELEFKDTGVGIAAGDLQKIYWPFWSRRADGNPGTGLGLSIVQAILQRLGGAITVKSKVGSGTLFTVSLPDADAETGQA